MLLPADGNSMHNHRFGKDFTVGLGNIDGGGFLVGGD